MGQPSEEQHQGHDQRGDQPVGLADQGEAADHPGNEFGQDRGEHEKRRDKAYHLAGVGPVDHSGAGEFVQHRQ